MSPDISAALSDEKVLEKRVSVNSIPHLITVSAFRIMILPPFESFVYLFFSCQVTKYFLSSIQNV